MTIETEAALIHIVDKMSDEDNLWATYSEAGILFSLHLGPEPEFSQDEGLVQINLTTRRTIKESQIF